MDCPKCAKAPLQPVQVDGVTVDRCPKCLGLWFDHGELQVLLAADPKKISEIAGYQVDAKLDRRTAHCPYCGKDVPMKRLPCVRTHKVSGDMCTKCGGVWLDGGELSRLHEMPSLQFLNDLFYA